MPKLKSYTDHMVRVVSFEALDAMCEYVSGVSHKFCPVKLTARYCYIQYENPDEYGTPDPVTAVYPLYREEIGGETMICVVLDLVKVLNNDEAGTMWQVFERLTTCPTLYRDPQTGEWLPAFIGPAVSFEDELAGRESKSDPVIISWRASNIHDIAIDILGRKLDDDEMEIVIHELDKLDFRDVDQCIEETIIGAVEKLEKLRTEMEDA